MTLTIEDVASWTGLSTRAIRNYIRDGFLQGDKSSGKWIFSMDQYIAFTDHPNVAPVIETKKRSLINDYIDSVPDGYNRICVLLDITDHLRETASCIGHYLDDHMDEIKDENVVFSMGPLQDEKASRIMIKGSYDLILGALAKVNEEKKKWE